MITFLSAALTFGGFLTGLVYAILIFKESSKKEIWTAREIEVRNRGPRPSLPPPSQSKPNHPITYAEPIGPQLQYYRWQ